MAMLDVMTVEPALHVESIMRMTCSRKLGKLQHVVMETIQKTLTEEVGKRLAFHVDDAKTVVVKHRQSEYGEVEVEKGLALLENVRKTLQLMRAIVQCTNASLQFGHAFGHAVGRSGLLLMTVQELARRLEMEVSDGRQEWMHILVSILGSCARVPENLEYFRDARAVDLLKKLKKESDMPIRVSSLRCLAHIADAEDTDLTHKVGVGSPSII
ncbi:Receptor-interacting serine/threonine-protein kinase 4 [Branchiostoma belcheri]|nr:Receptor-interacting serine/threonine-protein kinase 4 [Branchiostoma belcheri]